MYSIPVSVKAGLTPCAGYRFLPLLSSHLQTILATMPAITEEIKEKTSLIAITSFPCLCWRWQHIYYRVLKGLKNLTKTDKNRQKVTVSKSSQKSKQIHRQKRLPVYPILYRTKLRIPVPIFPIPLRPYASRRP